uniref:DUF3489 domain-containing protein n=1 Tax=Candidatus Magnetaquicoccus inordinatus TaxID=2496818 RepID=UPI00102AE0B7
ITKTGYAAIGMEAPQEIEDDAPAHGPGLDFSDDTVVQAWIDNMPAEDAAYHEEMAAACEEPDGPDDYDNPPIGIIVPMDPADLPRTEDNEVPADADFEADVAAAEQSMEAADETLPEVIDAIAKQYIQDHGFRVTRENLEKALLEAFKAGQANTASKTRTPRENSKKAIVMALLQRPEGATLQQIEQATDWGPNTIRGFLSLAKKKQGLNLETFRTRIHGTNLQGAKGSFTTYKVVL